jgi:hypothetical protein
LAFGEGSQIDEGAEEIVIEGVMRVTREGVHTDGDEGTCDPQQHRSGRTSALRQPYGLEKSHANAACCAGAMGGGSTASFSGAIGPRTRETVEEVAVGVDVEALQRHCATGGIDG